MPKYFFCNYQSTSFYTYLLNGCHGFLLLFRGMMAIFHQIGHHQIEIHRSASKRLNNSTEKKETKAYARYNNNRQTDAVLIFQ